DGVVVTHAGVGWGETTRDARVGLPDERGRDEQRLEDLEELEVGEPAARPLLVPGEGGGAVGPAGEGGHADGVGGEAVEEQPVTDVEGGGADGRDLPVDDRGDAVVGSEDHVA